MVPVTLFALVLLLQANTPAPQMPAQILSDADNLGCSATDDTCLAGEFKLRREADQSVRHPEVLARLCSTSSASSIIGTSCEAAAWHAVDVANLSRLKAIVDERGWPQLGGDAEVSAWLIAQHAPASETAFRDRVLEAVEVSVHAGRLDPQFYAMMADRNAINRGEQQPYGTQRYCLDDKVDLSRIDSVEAVDERRRKIDMEFSLTESLPTMNQSCKRDFDNNGRRAN